MCRLFTRITSSPLPVSQWCSVWTAVQTAHPHLRSIVVLLLLLLLVYSCALLCLQDLFRAESSVLAIFLHSSEHNQKEDFTKINKTIQCVLKSQSDVFVQPLRVTWKCQFLEEETIRARAMWLTRAEYRHKRTDTFFKWCKYTLYVASFCYYIQMVIKHCKWLS